MILAIDTASKTASVALVEGRSVLAEFSVLSEKTHSKAVLPMIESLFACAGKKPSDIEYIACSAGPGSFTGLRIGAAVAKSFAYTLNKKIVPVATLDMLAYNVLACGYTICPMLDARRSHVYTSFYKYDGGKLLKLNDYMTISVKEAVSAASSFGEPLYFIGGGADVYREELEAVTGAVIAPPQINLHRAGVMGVYAYDCLKEIAAVEGHDFELIYMSRSQAEADNG